MFSKYIYSGINCYKLTTSGNSSDDLACIPGCIPGARCSHSHPPWPFDASLPRQGLWTSTGIQVDPSFYAAHHVTATLRPQHYNAWDLPCTASTRFRAKSKWTLDTSFCFLLGIPLEIRDRKLWDSCLKTNKGTVLGVTSRFSAYSGFRKGVILG